MRLRLLTWNVHKCIGGLDQRYRPERVAEVIAWHEPDIVLLQEVDDGARRSRFDRQVDVLGDLLGFRHRLFHANHRLRFRAGHYGNAILARHALSEEANVDLTVSVKKRRGGLVARCRVRSGRTTRRLYLCNLHLGLSGLERKLQLRRLLASPELRAVHERSPLVIAGDLNDVYGTLGPKVLAPAGFRTSASVLSTFPAFAPVRALDSIHVRGQLELLSVVHSRLGAARQASDHLPLIAELELP